MWRHWNPFADLEALRRELNSVFDGFGLEDRGRRLLRSAFLPGISARQYPLLNMSENSEEVRVMALAPGLDIESLEVSVKGNTLTIAGEKKPLEGVEANQYHRNERSTGKFVRTIELGAEVDDEKVTASYKNGLLLVTLPKSERAKPRQISVNVA